MNSRTNAVRFIVALGLISLLADITYEGARSITGPYLGILGASAAAIGVVAGFGELAGYALRLISGYWADRTRSYWLLTITGYVINLCAVPALALAGNWPAAAALIILERAGKAVRTPSRDVMLSQAAHQTGLGWGFGLHEAMDQTGACMGPLIVALVLSRTHQYTHSFAILAIPAALAILTLLTARFFYPDPSRFEPKKASPGPVAAALPGSFWLYAGAAGLIAAGTADFALIAYHFQNARVTTPAETPIFYSAAMGIEGLAALFFGRLFDRLGSTVVVIGVILSVVSIPLLFLGAFYASLGGMLLWGAGLGAQNTSLKAGITKSVATGQRGSAFGIFNTVYGVSWFAGSALMGLLYETSLLYVTGFAMAAQLAAIPLLISSRHKAG